MDASRRWAADFELWLRFFRHAQIYPVDALIGGFRIHGDSLGLQNMEACSRIYDEFIEAELDQLPWGKFLRLSRRIGRRPGGIRSAGSGEPGAGRRGVDQ